MSCFITRIRLTQSRRWYTAISRFALLMAGLTIALLTNGCGEPLTREEVSGTYSFTFSPYGKYKGHETLTLRKDGTFHQVFTYADGDIKQNDGTWEFNAKHQISNLVLRDLVQYFYPLGDVVRKPEKYVVYTAVRKSGSEILITINEDADEYYTKCK